MSSSGVEDRSYEDLPALKNEEENIEINVSIKLKQINQVPMIIYCI